jgi:GNAT superfamily N-acetyltransferase
MVASERLHGRAAPNPSPAGVHETSGGRTSAGQALTRVVLGSTDIDDALALSDAAGWNQTADDWALFLGRGHALGWRSDAGELVATGAALPYAGGQGWISMVLVTPAWRHQGLATGLLDDCVRHLQDEQITPVLDATPAGAPVYRRLGFAPGFEFERWEAEMPAAGDSSTVTATVTSTVTATATATAEDEAPRPAGLGDLDLMAALDAAANRAGRRFLLEAFLSRDDSRAWMAPDDTGFVIVRAGRRATQIGPLVAADPTAALRLLRAALAGVQGPVFLDVPLRWTALTTWLQRQGFRRQRPFTRMALGPAASLDGSERLFVLAGPEFG